jgi:hypothetical protein
VLDLETFSFVCWEQCLMTTCTLNSGFSGKVRGAKLRCLVLHRSSPPFPCEKF